MVGISFPMEWNVGVSGDGWGHISPRSSTSSERETNGLWGGLSKALRKVKTMLSFDSKSERPSR